MFSIVCFTETFIDKTFVFPSSLHGYEKYVSPALKLSHQGRRSGGVVVMIKKELEKYIKEIQTDCENLVVVRIKRHLLGTAKDLLYISAYIPPYGSPFYEQTDSNCHILEVERAISDLLVRNVDVHILCNGDFNARTGNTQIQNTTHAHTNTPDVFDKTEYFTQNRASDDLTVNDFGKKLLDMCACLNLKLLNGCQEFQESGGFTYLSVHGYSVVDYFMASFDFTNCFEDCIVQNRIESDHMPIELHCRVKNVDVRTIASPAVQIEKLIWSDEKADVFKAELASEGFQKQLNYATSLIDTDPEKSICIFTESLNQAANSMKRKVSLGGERKSRPKWFDKECFVKKKEARGLLKKCRKTKAREDFLFYAKCKKEYKSMLDTKKLAQQSVDLNNLLASASNPNAFWAEIRKHRTKNVVVNTISEAKWVQHFETVFNEGFVIEEGCRDFEIDETLHDGILNADIDAREIVTAINKLKCGKAAGNDGILAEMLKHSNSIILPFLAKFFNTIFSKGYFPLTWSEGVIVPLHKKGDTNVPDNYRGISLLSILSKVFTHILNARLMLWSEQNGVICEAQAGFRKGRSTIDHIFTLNAIIERYLLKNSKLYVAFIDFKKAYDTVNRNILWSVLLRTGIHGKLLKMVQAIYTNVKACVMSSSGCNNTGYSRFFECLQGLKQGCVMSPILFSLLINELASEIIVKGKHGVHLTPDEIELFLLLFADDLTLLSATVVGLQNQLNILQRETARLRLTVNLDKSKIIVFRKGGFLRSTEKWLLGGRQLEVVNSYKYLGITFSTKLCFTAAMEETKLKGKKSTNEILSTLGRIGCSSPDIFFKLFDSQVVPLLLYASEIWGYKPFKQIEQVHLYACKRFLHVRNKTANDVVYGELGRFPLWITSTIRCIKYWLRLLKQPNERYSKKAYNTLLSMHEKGYKTWVTHIKSILCDNGFVQVWLFGCGNETGFIKELKDRLVSNFYHNWRVHLDSSERLSLYGKFKPFFAREDYIRILYVDRFRIILAQFRTGVSQLNTHIHRFSPSDENTACPLCPNAREDEIHFMFVCPMYSHIRKAHDLEPKNTNNLTERLVYTLSTRSRSEIVSVAKFLLTAFEIRQAFMDTNK